MPFIMVKAVKRNYKKGFAQEVLGFPIVLAKFTLLRNYTFCHNEF
jgi:hypothetical protein